MAIETRNVKDRRTLRFETIDALYADVDTLAAAERNGRLLQLGNWSLGTAINHVAAWAEFSYTGAPVPAPWFVRLIMKLLKRRTLTKGMPVGMRIPKVKGGTLAIEPDAVTATAVERLHTIMDRLRTETPQKPNVVLGRLTREEWIQLQLRHAELHLSFFKPM